MKQLKSFGFSIFILVTFVAFQNCSPAHFSAENNSNIESANNGSGYGGKPDGDFYHYVPGFTCENKSSFVSHVRISPTDITLVENKALACGQTRSLLKIEDIDSSPHQNMIVGYKHQILEGSKSATPETIPSNLVEVWCRSRADSRENEAAIETITYYDRSSRLASTRIYYSENATDGSTTSHAVAPFPVGRLISARTVSVRDGQGFDLAVQRDQIAPVAQEGLFAGLLKARLPNRNVEIEVACRLGGSLDASIWPAKRIVDINVLSLEHSSDGKYFSYSSDSARAPAGHGDLYLSTTDGARQLRVTSALSGAGAFRFTPNAKTLVYADNFSLPATLNSIDVDGANRTRLDSMTALNSFRFSSDGAYVLYQTYDRPTPPSSVELRSVPVGGGAVSVLNPPLAPATMGVSSVETIGERVIFLCCSMPTKLYSAKSDGTDLKVLNTPVLPSNWDIATQNLGVSEAGDVISLWAWSWVLNRPSVNYALASDGSWQTKLPEGWQWVSTSPNGSYGLLVSVNDPTQAMVVNLRTAKTSRLPLFFDGTERLIRDGRQAFEKHFFTRDSGSYLGIETNGHVTNVNLETNKAQAICQGVDALGIREMRSSEVLIAALDPASGLFSIYIGRRDGTCRKANSIPADFKSVTSLTISIADDQMKILVVVKGQNQTGEKISALYYVPLNGKAATRIDSPLSAKADIQSAAFQRDSKVVFFIGDQISAGENNVFTWTSE